MAAKGDFTVKVTKKDVVVPLFPRPDHWIPQSNMDLLLPPIEVCVFFCYKQPQTKGEGSFTFQTKVDVLKDSLAQLLVSHYVFCAEMDTNSLGEPELRCHTRGVEFNLGYADVELENLNLYNPDQSVREKLVPYKKPGVISCYQVTELKCGGIVVACTFDHRVADAFAINMFTVAWAEIAKTKNITVMPSYRRSLLSPRRPLIKDASIDNLYMPVSAVPPPKKNLNSVEDKPSRFYYIEAEQLRILQSIANKDNKTDKQRTRLEAFCAFMWKLVGSEEATKENKCSMGIVVDGRTRLNEGEKDESKLLNTYFGNVVSIPYGMEKAGDLQEKPLSWVANSVNEFLKPAATKDHFLNLIDWVESRRPEPNLARIYATVTESEGPAFVVSVGRDFPVSKLDFGWGTPVFGSSYFPWGGDTGFVHPVPSPVAEGDWVVFMNLSKSQFDVIEKQGGHVLRPMTYDYLMGGKMKNKILAAL